MRGRRTLRPLLAAVALAAVVAGVGGGLGLHSRLNGRQVAPAVNAPALPSPSVPTAHPAPTWEATPYDMRRAMVAWDSTHQQLVAFQPGEPKVDNSDHTWTWDGSWHEQHPAAGPANTYGTGVLVDVPALHGVALLTGAPGAAALWDGVTWHPLPAPGYPDCFAPTAGVWDEGRHQVVVIASNMCSGGGGGGTGGQSAAYQPHVWTWDARTWRNRGVVPNGPAGGELAWDPEANTVVLLAPDSKQAWSWTDSGWQVDGARFAFSFPVAADGGAWDARAGAILLYASPDAYQGNPAQMLAFHRGTWSQLPGTNYPERVRAIVADTTHRRLLAIGQEPIPLAQTPAPWSGPSAYYVLAWNGQGWSHVTWSELTGTP